MATAKVSVSRVIVYGEGNGAVITAPSKENPKGAWTLTAKQMRRLADSAGISVQNLRIAKGTLVVVGSNVKAGAEWSQVDRTTGNVTTGKYTKDHFRVEDLSIELSETAMRSIMVANVMAEQLLSASSQQREVVQMAHDDGGDDNDGPAEQEEPTAEEIEALKEKQILDEANSNVPA